MTDRVWLDIRRHLPVRVDFEAPTGSELTHAIISALADVSEGVLNTYRNCDSYAAYSSLADKTDILSAAIVDQMNWVMDYFTVRRHINQAIEDVRVKHGEADQRPEELSAMMPILIEEIGEIYEALQTGVREDIVAECADAIAVLYNIRAMTLHKAKELRHE